MGRRLTLSKWERLIRSCIPLDEGWGALFLSPRCCPLMHTFRHRLASHGLGVSLPEMRAHLTSPKPLGDRCFSGLVEDHLLPQAQ